MASEFTELCEMYGLSPGDPEAIDKLIHFMGEPDGEDDTWYFNKNADACFKKKVAKQGGILYNP